MCVSLRASLVAGIIGECTALYVMLRTSRPMVGAWMATYSLIQFYEASVYAGIPIDGLVLKRLLYAQGFAAILGLTHSFVYPHIAYSLAGALTVAYALDRNNYSKANCTHKCTWDATSPWIRVMYMGIFALGSMEESNRPMSAIYMATFAGSLLFDDDRQPSMWCFFSALAAPLAAATLS